MPSNRMLFDNDLNDFSDRKEYVEKILESHRLTQKELEQLGDYLLTSKDIESCREIECRFYLNDKKFRSYAEYKNVRLVDDYDKISFLYKNEQANYALEKSYLDRLFKFGNMKHKEKLRMIKNYNNNSKDLTDGVLKAEIDNIIQIIREKCKDKTNRKILNMTLDGYTQSEISEKLSLTQPAIQKRLKKILSL